MTFSKTIIIDPVWSEIENARNQIYELFKAKSIADDHIHAATMIISELIENGVKYGKFMPADQLEARVAVEDAVFGAFLYVQHELQGQARCATLSE